MGAQCSTRNCAFEQVFSSINVVISPFTLLKPVLCSSGGSDTRRYSGLLPRTVFINWFVRSLVHPDQGLVHRIDLISPVLLVATSSLFRISLRPARSGLHILGAPMSAVRSPAGSTHKQQRCSQIVAFPGSGRTCARPSQPSASNDFSVSSPTTSASSPHRRSVQAHCASPIPLLRKTRWEAGEANDGEVYRCAATGSKEVLSAL